MNMQISHTSLSQGLATDPKAPAGDRGALISSEIIEVVPNRAQLNFENKARALQNAIPLVNDRSVNLTKICAPGAMGDYFLWLEENKARRSLVNIAIDLKKDQLADLVARYPELAEQTESSTALMAAYKETLSPATPEQLQYYTAMVDAYAAGEYDVLSSQKINEMIFEAIGEISVNYLDVFQQAVEKNAAFFRDFTDFISKLRTFVDTEGESTLLKATGEKGFLAALDKLINTYAVPGKETTLYPVQTGGSLVGGDKNECDAWAREMGMDPNKCLYKLPSGQYIVHIDVSPLQTIKDSVININDDGNMVNNAAQWASWQTMLDLQKDTIQTGMQTLTQKYSNANSTFDNVVKILSSTISSLLEADKAFLHF